MRRLLLGSITTAVLSAAPLLAQEEGDLFAKLDANKDGFVSPDEVEGDRKAIFDRLLRTADKDGDKKLSKEEFAAGLKEPDQPRPPLGQGGGPGGRGGQFVNPRAILERLDANKDGKLSKDEAQGPLKERFEQADANGDGFIGADELGRMPGLGGPPNAQQVEAMFERADANKDGKITKDEVPEPLRERFDRTLEQFGIESLNKEQFGRFLAFARPGEPRPGDGRPGEPRPGDQKPGEGRPGDPRLGEPRPGDGRPPLFVALDADGDGELSAGEIEAAGKSLLKLDRNSDGKLTRDEIGPPSGPPGMRLGEGRPGEGRTGENRPGDGRPGDARPGDARPEGRGGFFARFNPAAIRDADTNEDGKLSKDEVEKAELPPMIKQGFARLDVNSDDFIDSEEIRAAFERFRDGDRPRGPQGDRRPDGDRPGAPPRE